MNTILVPLDGSPLGELALPYAELLARATGASLLLVRVATTPSAEDPTAPLHAYLDGVATRVSRAGISVDTRVLVGGVASAILDAVPRQSAQFLVVASHARTGAS